MVHKQESMAVSKKRRDLVTTFCFVGYIFVFFLFIISFAETHWSENSETIEGLFKACNKTYLVECWNDEKIPEVGGNAPG